MRRIFLLLLLACSFQTQAQKLKEQIAQDTITYVYKLNFEQTRFILKEQTVRDTPFLFTKKFKEYPRNRFRDDTLPDGNFLIAQITNNQVAYNYIQHVPFVFKTKVMKEEVYLFLTRKKDNALIREAKLEINGKPVPYDAGIGGYSISKKMVEQKEIDRGHVFIKIAYDAETYVYQFSLFNRPDAPPQKNYYNNFNAELNSPGYFILDKPKYKPLDTLRLKAFLVSFAKGRPIRRRTKLSITEAQQQFSYTKILKKKTPGAFTHDWCIPDTLKLDRYYDVKLRYFFRGRSMVKSTQFKLEEYELAKNVYEVDLPDPTFYAGDDVRFFVTAKDMNGFPIQGTQVHYQVRLINMLNLFQDSLRTSLEQRNNWYQKDTTIEFENYVEYRIPSQVFPNANAQYQLDVSFTDPVTFEKKAFSHSFTKFAQTEKVLFYQIDDSLYIRTLYNGKDTNRSFMLITMQGKDTVTKKKIQSPYTYHLQPLETAACIIHKDSTKSRIEIRYNKLEMMHVKGKRSGDSIRISFKYPFNDLVHYRIYKKDKLVKSGEGTNLEYTMPDQSLDEYRIQLTNHLQGGIEDNFYEYRFVPEKNKLYVESTIPKQAFPGDSLAVELTVKDFKHRTRRKVNVAAYAVNKAFSTELIPPYIDVPFEFQNLVEIKPLLSKGESNLSNRPFYGTFFLLPKHFHRFNLWKNEFFQLQYPKKDTVVLEAKKQQSTPEFAIIITQNYGMFSPKYILVDGQPVFISDVNRNDVYSIAVTEGKHDITFRYIDRLYEWKDVAFKSYTKYFFGFNMDSLKMKKPSFEIQDSLPVFELTDQEKALLYPCLLLTNTFVSDTLLILSSNLNEQKTYYQNYRINNMNIDGDVYFVQGPYAKNQPLRLKLNKKEFTLKPGVETVYHYDAILKEFQPKKLGPIKGAFIPFRELNLTSGHFVQQLQQDTVVKVYPKLNMAYHPEVEKAQKEQTEDEQNFYQSYSCPNSGNYFTIWTENTSDSLFIKSFWLVSKNKFEVADYIQSFPKQVFTINKYFTEETYDIYIFLNKNRMAILRDKKFNSFDVLYLNPRYLKTQKFVQDSIEVPLKIYAELHNTPLAPFYDTPFVAKERLKVKSSGRNNLYLHGMITDENQSPLDQALIYVEMNGVFRYGATTNANGLFEILDMIPGTYQIRVFHPEYKISYYPAQLLEAGKEYELLAMVKAKSVSAANYETIHNDFRFLAYARHAQENKMRITLHDKQSREQLQNYQIKLYYKNELLRTIQSTGNYTDFIFPEIRKQDAQYPNQEFPYSIEISKEGYTGLRLNYVYFRQHYFYLLDGSIGLRKKEILHQREYNLSLNQLMPISNYLETDNGYVLIEDLGVFQVNKLSGDVRDYEGKPISQFKVTLRQQNKILSTLNAKGSSEFTFTGIKDGIYEIQLSANGYPTYIIRSIPIKNKKHLHIQVTLTQEENQENKPVLIQVQTPTKPETITVSGEPNATYEFYTAAPMIEKSVNATSPSYSSPQYTTINTGDLVATMSGVYQKKSGDNSISIGGDRSSGTLYMIDGVMVRGSRNVNLNSVGESDMAYDDEKSKSRKDKFADSALLEQAIQNKNISSIRKVFSDVGFWKSNMVTNKQGKVAFTVKLPDNIGAWKTYILLMGKRFMHGIDSSEINVYKPLQSILSVPSFFYQGDQMEAKLKLQNLLRDPVNIVAEASINKKQLFSKKVRIENTYLDSVAILATKDSMVIEGGLIYDQRYRDFERYTIPVFKPSMIYHTHRSFLLDQDTSFMLQFKPGTSGDIIFNNYLLEKVMTIIEEVNQYEYGCVEQSCSKLNALLAKRRIQHILKQSFKQDKDIQIILSKLADMQNTDGSFGWWKRNGRSDRMTLYAMDVGKKALVAGYMNNIYNSCLYYVQQNWFSMNSSDQIYAYYLMLSNKVNQPAMDAHFKNLNPLEFNTTDKLYYYQCLRLLEQPVKEEDVYAVFLEMNNQASRPYTDNFFYDYRADIFKAYSLFKGSVYEKQYVNLFRKRLQNGQLEQNLNTFSKVALIDAMTQQGLSDSAKPIQSTITVNDSIIIKTYPAKIPIKQTQYRITHRGGDVFLNTAEKQESMTPDINDSFYNVRNYFTLKGEKQQTAKPGEVLDYTIDIQAYKKGEHVMLEIPIPSGMKVENKRTNNFYGGEYVEYYKNKVVYYFEQLPMGTKQIKISMKPVFRGTFVLAPVKISLMYYPYVYGNSARSEIKIN